MATKEAKQNVQIPQPFRTNDHGNARPAWEDAFKSFHGRQVGLRCLEVVLIEQVEARHSRGGHQAQGGG